MNLPILRPDIAVYGAAAVQRTGWVAGQVELTSVCDQHCVMCDSWRDNASGKHAGVWTLEQAKKFVFEDCYSFPTFESLTLTGGDPISWEPLDEFLAWYANDCRSATNPIRLLCNTALTREPGERWSAFDEVRVSLDAVDPDRYQRMRGDKHNTPDIILARMEELSRMGVAVSTNTTLTPHTIGDAMDICGRLEMLVGQGRLPTFRKAHFLCVIGPRGGDLNAELFWDRYAELVDASREWTIATGFADNILETRDFCRSPEATNVPCYAGVVSFHVKCNGDLFPCCLVGGEAISTRDDMKLGNVFTHTLRELHERAVPRTHYNDPTKPCSEICQWKQLQINVAGYVAQQSRLSMP